MAQLVDALISKIRKVLVRLQLYAQYEFSLKVERRAYTSGTVEHYHQLVQEISLKVER